MPTLDELRKKSKTLTCEPFEGFKITFERRLAIVTPEFESMMAEVAKVQMKIDRIQASESSEFEKQEQIERIEVSARDMLERQLPLLVAGWDLAENEGEEPIALTEEALRAAKVPLEVYTAMMAAISEEKESPLVPLAKS